MQLKVLIAEDDKHTRTIMEHIFQKDPAFKDMQIELLLAPDGEVAWQLFQKNRVDLVISDLLMPKMDGFAFCRAVRDSAHGKDIPIVITSAIYKETALLNRLREELGVVFFPKPFQVREFTHEILQLLKRGDATDAGPPKRTRITMSGPFQGTLDVRPLATLLLDIYDIEGTGVLLLEQGKMQKEIFFLFGRPMGAESNIRHEMLGNYLVTKGVLTEKRHQELLATAKNTRVSFLKALLEAKEFDQDLVLKYHASLVKVRIVNAFRWHTGNYTFSPGDTFSERLPKSPVDPVALVFAGLKRGADLDEITARVQNDLFSTFKFNERFKTLHDEFVRVFGDAVLAHLAAPGATIADVLAKGVDPMTVYTQVYALLETGMCFFVRDARSQAAASSMRMPVVDDPLSISNIKKVLYQPEATEGEISVVADLPMPGGPAAADDGLILDIPMEIEDAALEEKKRRLREFYLDIREKDYFQALGLPPTAGNLEIGTKIDAVARSFAIAAYADVDLGEDHVKLEEILEYLKIAHQTLTDPARKAAYLQKTQADRIRGESILDAEVLVQKAEEHLDQGRPREALQMLDKARRLQPEVPDFHALYALAAHRAREAENTVNSAIFHALELGPESPTVNLCAGAVAEGQGRVDEAVRHFEKVLEVDSENQRAFDELDRILRARGDFRIVERLHRKLLHQFGNRRPQRTLALARSLALLYEEHLTDLDKARAAWEIVHAIAPQDTEAAEAMERLTRLRARLSPEALAERLEGVRKELLSPEARVNACLAGFRLARESAPDLAYLFAAALEALDADAPEARAFHQQFTPPFLARAWRAVDAELWELAQDPEDFPFVGKIFETLGMHVPEGRFFPKEPAPRVLGPGELPPAWERALTYLAGQCSIPVPPVATGNATADVTLTYLDTTPALHVSDAALGDTDIRRIAALAAPYCTSFWTGRALPMLATPPQMLLLLKIVIGFVSQKPAGADAESQRLQALLAGAPELRAALTQTISEVSSKMGNLNVSNWVKAVHRSGLHVALMLTANLPELYRRAPEDLRPGLLSWALSDRHVQARRLLGVSIDV